jgi:glycine oxidase
VTRVTTDVIVAGGGVIGLCSALAVAERKMDVLLISEPSPGEASRAAAGMLAPSVERASAETDAFGIAARDRYPSYLDFLRDLTGLSVPLNRLGILQIALSEKGIKGLRRSAGPESSWLDREELSRLEPALSHALGAVFNPLDGCVDNVALVDALSAAVAKDPRITFRPARVASVSRTSGGVSAMTADGEIISAERVVIAAGAWSSAIVGARFAQAVTPARGQLIAFENAGLSRVVYGPRGYLVPRDDTVIGGSTMERTGFDASTTEAGIAKVTGAAGEICPPLSSRKIVRAWAGLRPVTPDLRPIIGPDPEFPEVIYACGHGRNGILMAPLTGDLVADLVTGSPLPHDLVQFRPDRF